MVKQYPVMLGDTQIGSALVQKDGLFYTVSCSCGLTKTGRYRLFVQGARREKLGLLVPGPTGYSVKSRILISKLGQGDLAFFVAAEDESYVVPVTATEPFPYIAFLDEAHMYSRGNEVFVALKTTESQSSGLA